MITHLEPDILECVVKWALRGITVNKASGGDGIPVELFQILKRGCCESAPLNMPANSENSAVATGLEKISFHSNPKVRQCQRMLKLPHNCTHLSSVRFSRSVVSNSLRPHELKSESEVTQSCPTLSDPLDCSLPGSSVHGIFQARVLEWVAKSSL